MRVVLDTNEYISALVFGGMPRQVLVVQTAVLQLVEEILSRWHWLNSLPNGSSGVPVLYVGISGASAVILSVMALFVGAAWVRRRSINGANALS
jgi:hypothetical protein